MAMITATMTLRQKKNQVRRAAGLLDAITAQAVIAGGYPRDIILGVLPKDIDIFINASHFNGQQGRDEVADRIFAAFGQTWTREHPEGRNQDYAGPDDIGFHVYYMHTTQGEWEPINLIFSGNNDRAYSFDWSICEFYVQRNGEIDYDPAVADLNYIVARDLSNLPQAIAHALRIREKFPTARFSMQASQVRRYPNHYIQLVEGGVFNNVPRQDVQAQAPGVNRDQVRFNAGEGIGGQARFTAWEDDPIIQQFADAIPTAAPVIAPVTTRIGTVDEARMAAWRQLAAAALANNPNGMYDAQHIYGAANGVPRV